MAPSQSANALISKKIEFEDKSAEVLKKQEVSRIVETPKLPPKLAPIHRKSPSHDEKA